MELQALAFTPSSWLKHQPKWLEKLAFLHSEDFILICILLSARPDFKSMSIGGGLACTSLILMIWIQAYGKNLKESALVGPYRFMRFPLLLALWLSSLALCLAARSFPGLLLSLGLLTCLYYFERQKEEQEKAPNTLASYRYKRFVPALIPCFLPYPKEPFAAPSTVTWRQALLGFNRPAIRHLSRLLLGWFALLALMNDYIPLPLQWTLGVTWILFIGLRITWNFLRKH